MRYRRFLQVVISKRGAKGSLVSWPAWRGKEHDHVRNSILHITVANHRSYKTLLNEDSSFVIDYLSEGSMAKDLGIAYYYFDYKNQQPLNDVVAALVKQFCLLKTTIPYAVLNLFDSRADDEQRPSLSSLLKVLRLLSGQLKQSYIILDAVDEHESVSKREMYQLFQGLKDTSSRVFITSRQEASHVSKILFSCSEEVEITATEEDVGRYIEDRIA